jgi:hypothetical protein
MVTLSVSMDWWGGGVRVWTNSTRGPGEPLLDNSDWSKLSTNWPASQMPATLWVEGVSPSWYLNDVSLSLTTDDGCPAYTNLTVFGAQLGVDVSRNGSVSYGTTSSTNPFCFWINNNHDGYERIWNLNGWNNVQDDLSGKDDLSETSITCTRDLEDFSVLGINLSELTREAVTNGSIVVKLESAGPQIRLFPQFGSGTAYLTDSNTAQQQITAPYTASVGTIGDPLPNWLWTNSAAPNLLYYGISGQGELKVALYAKDGTLIGHGQSVWLNLQDVKQMYDSGSGAEANQYILFVHGMGMSDGADGSKVHFANTAYKRLWWQGYKGHFGAFEWPCLGFTAYDQSEYNAWQSATALKDKLDDLNSSYSGNVYLFAHSQGNVVAGEALRLGATVNDYVACQGAVSAHAYSPGTPNWPPLFGTNSTPDDYAVYPPTGVNYFNSVSNSRANFFNVNDWALGKWVFDQKLKPDIGYDYWNTNYWNGSTLLTYTNDTYKIFAYCVQSRSYALGATSGVGGFGNVDLMGLWLGDPFGRHRYKEHCWHSGEFLFSTVEQWNWWGSLMDSFHLQRN